MTFEQIGRHIIKGEIGRGGMATVYHAYDPRFERDVAIKVLPQEFLHDPTFRARFEREAKIIAALEHPAIVPVHDFGEEEGQPYLVMRYMSGGSLTERIRQGPLSLVDAAAVVERIAPALDIAHARGIIHRDLKPSNILFDQYNYAFLVDFGIVKMTEATAALTGSAVIGTPGYMSPEQVRGQVELDGRSDVYSLGIVLYEMLIGDTPYHANTPMGLAMMHVMEPVPSILEADPYLPPECETVIAWALAKDREQRCPTATALADAFGDLVATAPAGAAPAIAAPPVPPPQPAVVEKPAAPPTPPDVPTTDDVRTTPAAPARPPVWRRRVPWAWVLGGSGLLVIIMIVIVLALISMSNRQLESTPEMTAPSTLEEATTPDTPTPRFTDTPTCTPSDTPTMSPTPTDTPTATPTLTASPTSLPPTATPSVSCPAGSTPSGEVCIGGGTYSCQNTFDCQVYCHRSTPLTEYDVVDWYCTPESAWCTCVFVP